MIPEHLKYSRTHEWACLEDGNVVTMGITAYAAEQLGDIVFLDLPKAGTQTRQGQPMGVIESVKAAVDLYAPVTGSVVESNSALASQLDLIAQAPYGQGWMVKIQVADASVLAGLLTAEQYRKHCEEEPKH